MKGKQRAGETEGQCGEQVSLVFLHKEDIWVLTHLLPCLGGVSSVWSHTGSYVRVFVSV